MPKEKSINPAQAQRKAEKAKAIKKGAHHPLNILAPLLTISLGKAEAQSRRNEKLAHKNPDRLQKQVDDLKAIESSGGKLNNHEKSVLEGLERDLKAVRKAREALGEAAPRLGSVLRDGGRGGHGGDKGGRGGGVLGKRRREEEEEESSDSDVPEDVKRIPMPRDTPPPIAKELLDKWYQARRERLGLNRERDSAGRGTNANSTPLGNHDRRIGAAAPAPQMPPEEVRTVYEAKPVIRDLRKEAVNFVPAAVRVKMEKGKGVGGLVEPEEADRLEKEGYMPTSRSASGIDETFKGQQDPSTRLGLRTVEMEEVEDEDG